MGFNTSYVSVQVNELASFVSQLKEFQYILCVGSSLTKNILSVIIGLVSIHPMCRFKVGF